MNASTNSPAPPGGESPDVKDLERVLGQAPFFRGLRPEHLRLLAVSSMRMRYQPGELIIRQGDPANRFYLIEDGRVSLESRRAEGAPAVVEVIGPGDVVGWSWLFPPYVWQFDARAEEPTTAIFFYGTRLREQCDQDHSFGYEIMKRVTQVVIRRLQAARQQLVSIRD